MIIIALHQTADKSVEACAVFMNVKYQSTSTATSPSNTFIYSGC